jgi:hypothetical protein
MFMKVIRQYEYENESWKRVLVFFQEESINFKKRLADILNYEVTSELLERAEYFQNKFISHDEMMRLLFNDIIQQQRSLVKEGKIDGERFGLLIKKQQRLRNDIKLEEEQFARLREEFNSYVAENFLQLY